MRKLSWAARCLVQPTMLVIPSSIGNPGMFDNSSQQQLRQIYFDVWQKYLDKTQLNSLEQQILSAILEHPEYHGMFEKPDSLLEKQYHATDGETNPFLHLGLHLGLREQLSTNRPAGIVDIYKKLSKKMSTHDVEHQMMQCLAETLFQAQRDNCVPSDDKYLALLKKVKIGV